MVEARCQKVSFEQVQFEAAQEQVILVDEDDRQIGICEKMETHRAGALHRAFSIFVFDSAGRLLLQKRAREKYHSGGLWSNTCCGHPRPGETTAAAAHRRLREEMNFDCRLERAFSFLYRVEFDNHLIEHELDHVFVGYFDGDPAPAPSEVEAWRWISVEELARGLRESAQQYSYWLATALGEEGFRRLSEISRTLENGMQTPSKAYITR